jgi:hypothetical protein
MKTNSHPFSKLNKLLLFLFILFLPCQLGKHFFFSFSYISGVRTDYLAPTIYLTDIIALSLFFLNYKNFIKLFKNKRFTIVLSLLVLSGIFSLSKPVSLYRLIKIVEVIGIAAIFRKGVKDKLIMIGFAAGGVVELAIALMQIINNHSLQGICYFLGERYFSLSTPGIAKASIDGVEIMRAYGTFSHPNSLAGFYLLLYFYFLTNKKYGCFLILKYFSLLVFSLLILFSFSKVALITFFILNTGYFMLNTKSKCRPCFAAKVAVMVVLAAIFLRAQTDPLTVKKRFDLIKNSLTIISRYPFTGVGPGNYLFAQTGFPSVHYNFLNQPVHNIFLLLLAEIGIVVGTLVLFLTRKYLMFFLRKKVIYLTLAVLLTGLFDHYWLTLQQNILLLAVIFGGLIPVLP